MLAAQTFLETELDAKDPLERVSHLITGFETPYGMERLATVHWVAQENPQAAKDVEVAIALVHEWSDSPNGDSFASRKRNLFKPKHIRKAWQRLHEQNWLALSASW